MPAFVVPLLVLVLGALVYAFAAPNVKAAEIGKLAYFVGLFWLVYLFAAVHPAGAFFPH